MSKKLIVTPYNDGSLIRQKAGSEYGSIMIQTEEQVSINNGVVNRSKRVGHIRDKVENLNALGITAGMDFNTVLAKLKAEPVDIYVEESTTPFFEGQTPKMNPTTEAIIKDKDGNPIYYQTVVATAGTRGDVHVPSGNSATVAATSGVIGN